MQKKYIVRLTEAERAALIEVVKRMAGPSQKVRRAQILLKADVDGPAWTDARIADAFGCRTKTVENVRERFVVEGFETTLAGKPRAARAKRLGEAEEAQLLALRLGPPPAGRAQWTLRLLADKAVELSLAESVSHETIRRILKRVE